MASSHHSHMPDHLLVDNHPGVPNSNHQTLIDLNAFPEEEHMTPPREKVLYGNAKNSNPNQDGSLESSRQLVIVSVAETTDRSLVLRQPKKRGRKPRNVSDRLVERPEWLPLDWGFKWEIRTAGKTAGMIDKYFFAPSGQKFRSKIEVLHFLETGSKRKKKLKSDADATPSEIPSGSRKKKSTPNVNNFSDLKFDFRNPPQSLTWVQADDCPDDWVPSAGNTIIPESERTEWGTVFSRVSQLDRSNGAF